MRKKEVKTTPHSPNVVKVWYSDGTWGLRSTYAAPSSSIPDHGSSGSPIEWSGEATEGNPASPEESEGLEELMRKIRTQSGSQFQNDELSQNSPQKKGGS